MRSKKKGQVARREDRVHQHTQKSLLVSSKYVVDESSNLNIFYSKAPLEDDDKKLTHRQKQRVAKREQKKVVQKAKLKEKRAQQPLRQKKYNSDSEPEYEDELAEQAAKSSEEEEIPLLVPLKKQKSNGFTDDNKDWLKPKSKMQRKVRHREDEPGSDEIADEEAEEQAEDEDFAEDGYDNEDNAQVGKLDDLFDDEGSSEFDVSDEELESNGDDDNEDREDNDKLPIERANKKLKKRQAEDDELAEKEMQMTVDQADVFRLPEPGEEAETELSLQVVQQRIKEITQVLTDFARFRQEGRSRSEYVDQLRSDLCLYYSYNEFLMSKLMDIFKLSDLLEYLEASEVSIKLFAFEFYFYTFRPLVKPSTYLLLWSRHLHLFYRVSYCQSRLQFPLLV